MDNAESESPPETGLVAPPKATNPTTTITAHLNGSIGTNDTSDADFRVKVALAHHDAGRVILPVDMNGTKMPSPSCWVPGTREWGYWKSNRPTREQVEEWARGHDGIGMITGAISGNVEMIEFEGCAVTAGLHEEFVHLLNKINPELLTKVMQYTETTPRGGVHWTFVVDGAPVAGNTKLAQRPRTPTPDNPTKTETLIETRGDGGFTVIAPSGGRTHPNGGQWRLIGGTPGVLPVLTADEVETLHSLARTFDQMPKEAPVEPRQSAVQRERTPGEKRPGDDFNERADWADILVPEGWTLVGTRGDGSRLWRRPGKNHGISATTGYGDQGHDLLYVFSTSTVFEAERSYSKLGAYALLNTGGDYAKAASELRRQGYGSPLPKPERHDPLTLIRGDGEGGAPPLQSALAVVESTTPVDDEPLWQRPVMAHLRQFARARGTSPLAVLGCVLARAVAMVPPDYVLPAYVGGLGSLNQFYALVGRSGAGKGAAEQAAQDALHLVTGPQRGPLYDWRDPISERPLYAVDVGSGEGVLHAYAKWEKDKDSDDIKRIRASVAFSVPEIDHLAAVGSRQGSTLLPMLRKAWSGEPLNPQYVDHLKRLRVERHTYRCTLTAGVQPLRAGVLLDDSDGGTPQRFVWLPTADPDAPTERPQEPMPLQIRIPLPPGDRHIIRVCQEAETAIVTARHLALRDEGDPLDSHRLYAQEKAAAGLALLDGHLITDGITAEDWHLAGLIMAASDATRERVETARRDQAAVANRIRGQAEGQRESAKADVLEQASIHRASRAVLRKLGKASGEWVSGAELKRSVRYEYRSSVAEALELLEASGQVEVEPIPGQGQQAVRYRSRS